MTRLSSRSYLIVIPLLVLLASTWYVIHGAARSDTGEIILPLDDAYIHMAISRSLADTGHWNLTGSELPDSEFQPGSSSPLWTLIIAGVYKIGFRAETISLILCSFFAVLSIVSLYWLANRQGWPPLLTLGVALAVVLGCPLCGIVFTGMEHSLQICLTLLLLGLGGEFLASDSRKTPWALLALAFLATATRYESAFLVAVIGLALAYQNRWRPAILLGIASVAPIAIYAIYSLSHGGLWAPNSILAKTLASQDSTKKYAQLLLIHALYELGMSPRLTGMLLSVVAFAFCLPLLPKNGQNPDRHSATSVAPYLCFLFLATAWLHLDLAKPSGMFGRYDAYLLVLAIFTLGSMIIATGALPWFQRTAVGWRPSMRTMALAITLVFAVPMAWRSIKIVKELPMSSLNLYGQQIQMAQFLREYYSGETIGVNDIGAVAFFGNVNVLDLMGLASTEVTREKMKGAFNSARIESLCREHNAHVAVVYDFWFPDFGGVPKTWTPVGKWTLPNSVGEGSETVWFYATDPASVDALRQNLEAYAAKLPKRVSSAVL